MLWSTGVSPNTPPHPLRGARWPAVPRVVPWGAALPPAAQTPVALSGPGPQWPQARTRLLDGDGEAVVVGAALGLHRHVAGGVTCRRGGRVRCGWGHTALASRCNAPGCSGARSQHTAGEVGATASRRGACSAGALCSGSPRAWGRDTSRMTGLHHGSHKSLWSNRMSV